MPESPAGEARPRRSWKKGCAAAALAVAAVAIGAALFSHWRAQEALLAQEARAEQVFTPALDALQGPARAAPPGYDIDQTVRVIHEIDQAVKNSRSLEEWLGQMSRQDYRQVAPEVLAARRDLLQVLMKLYARQVAVEDQQALWDFSSGMMVLSAMSMVSVEGDVNLAAPSGSLAVDQEQAKTLLNTLLKQREEQDRLLGDLRASEAELTAAMVKYSDVYYRYVEEWDRLSLARDRAYLAVWNQDWAQAAESADVAIQMAPKEQEAHLLKALALIEGSGPERLGEAEALLTKYLEEHPDRGAPALLLLGVAHARQGDLARAQLDFQQAAVDYPRQADALTDMLDPYRARAHLKKSEQGRYVLEIYQSTMLGAGYFSPDLQLARLAFDAGDFEGGRQKVLNHFRRRSNQAKDRPELWSFILSDLQFCYDMLGDDYWRIFPEDTYLDLLADEQLFGDAIKVRVRNRSDVALHNATLILAVRVTDMFPGDYETALADETQPLVAPGAETAFGAVTVRFTLFGQEKGPKDIIQDQIRAILVTDEAVIWVDTQKFKIDQLAALEREKAAPRAAPAEDPLQAWTRSVSGPVLAKTRDQARLSLKDDPLKDDLSFQLPRELALLRPLFQLRHGGAVYDASTNIIAGENIELSFVDVDNFEQTTDIELLARTPIGEVVMTWQLAPDGTARLMDLSLAAL